MRTVEAQVFAVNDTDVHFAYEVEDYDKAVATDGFTGMTGMLHFNGLLDQDKPKSHGFKTGQKISLTIP